MELEPQKKTFGINLLILGTASIVDKASHTPGTDDASKCRAAMPSEVNADRKKAGVTIDDPHTDDRYLRKSFNRLTAMRFQSVPQTNGPRRIV